MNLIKTIKAFTLPISMLVGIAAYFIYTAIPTLACTKPFVSAFISIIQPALIFSMLFITFCKIDMHSIRLRPWHLWLLGVQVAFFLLMCGILLLFPHTAWRVVVEGALLCLICPTATAAAVVTNKLGGSAADITTYTILINLTTAVVVPLMLPAVHPQAGITFANSFGMILGKVFPLLFCPFIAALAVHQWFPTLRAAICRTTDLAFYLWTVALAIAIAVTVKSIMHSQVELLLQVGIAIASLICCILQFAIGRLLGARYGSPISGGQALGQKNTVFAIWMGYTFLTPVTSIAGGFYSVWHNVFNSYQLYRAGRS